MGRTLGFAALITFWGLRLRCARANPSLEFPINAQVPPVARVLQPYAFAFSASTFTSSSDSISYSLSEQPSWLRIDSQSRTISGTPHEKDEGSVTFDVVATDSDGSTSSSTTLVVLASNELRVGIPALPQLNKAGPTSGPDCLLLKPLQAFAFSFEPGTFIGTTSETSFYAISADNTPLPSWVQFVSSTLAFSGTSPSLVSPSASPQSYGIKLVASDVLGFSEASIEFQIIVGYHVLTSSDVTEIVRITPGATFKSADFRNSLTLDGQSVPDSIIVSVTADGPAWVNLDTNTISLSGIPPTGTKSLNVTISIVDIYGDTLNIIVELDNQSGTTSLFTSVIPDANATAGKPFSYTISEDLLKDNEIQLSANLGNGSTWLSYSPGNRTIHGLAPQNLPAGPETITLVATENMSTEKTSFVVNVMSEEQSNTGTNIPISSAEPSTSATTIATASHTPQPGPRGSQRSTSSIVKIVLAVVLPILFVAFIGCLLCLRQRRHSRRKHQRNSASQEAMIIPKVDGMPNPEAVQIPAVPRTPSQRHRQSALPRPPRIELPSAPDSIRASKIRMSKRLRGISTGSAESLHGNFIVEETSAVKPKHSQQIRRVDSLEETSQDDVPSLREAAAKHSHKMPMRSTQNHQQDVAPKILPKRYSTISVVTTGLPQRLSGAGHGAGGAPPNSLSDMRTSWQTTAGTASEVESIRSTVVLKNFPSPPREHYEILERTDRNMSGILSSRSPSKVTERTTVRLVRKNSTELSGLQKWYTERARDRFEGSARFSSASSRPSSSSRALWEPGLGPRRKTSGSLLHDNEPSNLSAQHTFSGLAERRRNDSVPLLSPASYLRTPSKLRRDISATSSDQFESARSTESWEDENLDQDENEISYWMKTGSPGHRTSKRVKITPREKASSASMSSPVQQIDRGGYKNVENRQTNMSERNEQGNLAFL